MLASGFLTFYYRRDGQQTGDRGMLLSSICRVNSYIYTRLLKTVSLR